MTTAHVLDAKKRTADISTDIDIDFESLLLSPKVLEGLCIAGFQRPSPIQLEAIPLAKCGLDLICQAKSGTGKTCVFVVCALEAVDVTLPTTQVLVLAPTREIAHQIYGVMTSIGVKIDGLKCCLFIGGIPIDTDLQNIPGCHIAIGTPGRIRYLIEKKHLLTESIRLFVLDEADKLLEEGSFQKQINWIFSTLGMHKQVLALSATYPESLAMFLTNYMHDAVHVRINPQDLTLKGIRQCYKKVTFHPLPHKAFENKCEFLLQILQRIPFQQCMIFSNYQKRAEHLSKLLSDQGWPCTYIAGSQLQKDRLHAMNQLKNYNCRILITTDLTSRGIDCDKVNLVVNLDLPWDAETYLHRVGRAGRFGSHGTAVSLVTEGDEYKELLKISDSIKRTIVALPDDLECLCDFLAEELGPDQNLKRTSTAHGSVGTEDKPCLNQNPYGPQYQKADKINADHKRRAMKEPSPNCSLLNEDSEIVDESTHQSVISPTKSNENRDILRNSANGVLLSNTSSNAIGNFCMAEEVLDCQEVETNSDIVLAKDAHIESISASLEKQMHVTEHETVLTPTNHLKAVHTEQQTFSIVDTVSGIGEHAQATVLVRNTEHAQATVLDGNTEHAQATVLDHSTEHTQATVLDRSTEHAQATVLDRSTEGNSLTTKQSYDDKLNEKSPDLPKYLSLFNRRKKKEKSSKIATKKENQTAHCNSDSTRESNAVKIDNGQGCDIKPSNTLPELNRTQLSKNNIAIDLSDISERLENVSLSRHSAEAAVVVRDQTAVPLLLGIKNETSSSLESNESLDSVDHINKNPFTVNEDEENDCNTEALKTNGLSLPEVKCVEALVLLCSDTNNDDCPVISSPHKDTGKDIHEGTRQMGRKSRSRFNPMGIHLSLLSQGNQEQTFQKNVFRISPTEIEESNCKEQLGNSEHFQSFGSETAETKRNSEEPERTVIFNREGYIDGLTAMQDDSGFFNQDLNMIRQIDCDEDLHEPYKTYDKHDFFERGKSYNHENTASPFTNVTDFTDECSISSDDDQSDDEDSNESDSSSNLSCDSHSSESSDELEPQIMRQTSTNSHATSWNQDLFLRSYYRAYERHLSLMRSQRFVRHHFSSNKSTYF